MATSPDQFAALLQQPPQQQQNTGSSNGPVSPDDFASSLQGQPAQQQQQTQQPQSFVSRLGAQFQPDLDLLKGVGEGVAQTVHGTGELIRRGGNLVSNGLGDAIVPTEGQTALQQIATPTNTTQKVGKTAEDIGEFLLGGEALKGLSIGEKLMQVGKVADYYDKASPFVKSALEYAMNITRGSAVGAGEGAIKSGGDAGEIEKGAALGAAGEAAAPVVKGALGVIGKGAESVASKAKALITDVPAETESKLVGALADIADKNGLEMPEDTSTARDAVKSLADGYQGRAQGVYSQLDKDVPGFQDLREEMLDSQKQARALSQIDPVKSKEAAATADDLRDKMTSLLSDDQKTAWQNADADYTRYKALQRVQGKVNRAGEDLTSDELTNASTLQSGFRSLANSTKNSRPIDYIRRAFGDDADDVLQIVQEGANLANERQAAMKLVGWLGAGSVTAAGIEYAGHKLGKALSGGEH
jgi:hypothetical protein